MLARRDVLIYTGKSMAGTFLPGDLLHVAPDPLHRIRPGDVVVYRTRDGERPPRQVVHRAVRALADGLVAQGDVNPLEDGEFVNAENLVGKVVSFERNGSVLPVAGGKAGLRRAMRLRGRQRIQSALRKCVSPLKWLRGSSERKEQ